MLLKLIEASEVHVGFRMFLGNDRVLILRGYMAECLRDGDVALPEFDRKLGNVLGSKKMYWEDLETVKADTKFICPVILVINPLNTELNPICQ